MYYKESKNIKDIYILPLSVGNREIVYSPLRGTAFVVDSNTALNLMTTKSNAPIVKTISEQLPDIKCKLNENSEVSIEELSQNLVILLSNSCNLGCKYCYAQYEREKGFLSKDKIMKVVDFVFNLHKSNSNIISVSFLGGGEPTLNWELLTWAIEYARQRAALCGIKLRIGFPTNATLLNSEKIDFLVKNNVEVGVSFELLPDIQNEHRPFAHSNMGTYQTVQKNVYLLNEKGIKTRFRSTITPSYAHRMEEMVEHVAKEFPFIKKIHFEPIYPLMEGVEDSFDMMMFYDKFIEHFMRARYIGDSYGIDITTAATNTLSKIKPRYCRGELCLTPNGDLVICHRSSSEKDARYSNFKYGLVSDEKILIDDVQFQNVNKRLNQKNPQCNDCFSRWHCSGMCLSNREMFTQTQFQMYCSYVRKIQSQYIEYLLQKGGVLNESDRSLRK